MSVPFFRSRFFPVWIVVAGLAFVAAKAVSVIRAAALSEPPPRFVATCPRDERGVIRLKPLAGVQPLPSRPVGELVREGKVQEGVAVTFAAEEGGYYAHVPAGFGGGGRLRLLIERDSLKVKGKCREEASAS